MSSPSPCLFTQVRRETVWKLRKGFVTGSYKTAERGERAPFPALGVTKRGAIRPAQRLSRQSLEGVFSEVRPSRVLGSPLQKFQKSRIWVIRCHAPEGSMLPTERIGPSLRDEGRKGGTPMSVEDT